jgi:hypothetical protein
VSESRGEGQPEGSAQPSNSAQPNNSGGQPSSSGQPSSGQPSSGQPSNSGGQPSSSGQPSSGQPSSRSQPSSGQPSRSSGQLSRSSSSGNGQSGSGRQPRPGDPVADFQRWLMKAGARSMANQVAGQVKRTLGTERRDSGDVWDTATNEPPPNEAPECQWCPVCQAARAARLGGGSGLGAQLANAGGALASVVQDAFSVFEQAMKTQDQNRSAERPGTSRPGSGASDRGETGQ